MTLAEKLTQIAQNQTSVYYRGYIQALLEHLPTNEVERFLQLNAEAISLLTENEIATLQERRWIITTLE